MLAYAVGEEKTSKKGCRNGWGLRQKKVCDTEKREQ